MDEQDRTPDQALRPHIAPPEPYIWRPRWFITTRFIAVFGVIMALLASRYMFGIVTFNYPALWLLTVILLVTNLLYLVYLHATHLDSKAEGGIVTRQLVLFTTVQINCDLVILTAMIHFSGGATNPFIFYYFFHTILSSILLSNRAAYIEAGIAAFMLSSITILEGHGIIRHYDLFCPGYHTSTIFIYGMLFTFTSALVIAVYMATSIMERLRRHESDLELAIEEMKRIETEKSRLMDVVAHDLKSPIAAVETMVSSLLQVHSGDMLPVVKKTLERIPVRTSELIHFIQELLEFSRITKLEQLSVEMIPLDFLPVVKSTADRHKSQALAKKLTFDIRTDEELPLILGSKPHLERMSDNLISNAVRYTPEGGEVSVGVKVESQYVLLTVSDTGIGIPESALPYIFTDFYRAPNARKYTSSGTGLGMAITKAIVDMHGGTISVKSKEGAGTTVTVRIPSQ